MFGSGNNRFVLFAIGLGTFLALVGMATVYDWSSGTGRIHVVGPRDAPMTIFVDGVEVNAVGVGEHLRPRLPGPIGTIKRSSSRSSKVMR